jgi:hypothetical protein
MHQCHRPKQAAVLTPPWFGHGYFARGVDAQRCREVNGIDTNARVRSIKQKRRAKRALFALLQA